MFWVQHGGLRRSENDAQTRGILRESFGALREDFLGDALVLL